MKYKHKKLGWIAEVENRMAKIYYQKNQETYCGTKIPYGVTHENLPAELIENSDDWIKVPDWTITAFKSTGSEIYFRIKDNDLYSYVDEFGRYCADDMLHKECCVDSGDWMIYSVRRADGVEFKIGDKVDAYSFRQDIRKFHINGDTIIVTVDGGSFPLDAATHYFAPQPLFVTEDGVEAYIGDSVITVCDLGVTGDYKVTAYFIENKDFKFFSTRESALEWIKWNQPRYSLNDVKEWYTNAPHISCVPRRSGKIILRLHKKQKMREIKFRAWDHDSKTMYRFNQPDGVEIGGWYITFDGKVFERHDDMGGDFQVENVELMQSTGLLDKNGKEIFEGIISKQISCLKMVPK